MMCCFAPHGRKSLNFGVHQFSLNPVNLAGTETLLVGGRWMTVGTDAIVADFGKSGLLTILSFFPSSMLHLMYSTFFEGRMSLKFEPEACRDDA